MQAVLMGFSICVLGVMVTMLLFVIAMRPDEEEAPEEARPTVAPETFFAEEVVKAAPEASIPLEVTLLKLEEHVRSEQRAARLFLEGPSTESLHAPSDSPLWH